MFDKPGEINYSIFWKEVIHVEIMSFRKKSNSTYEIEVNTGDKYKLYDDVILKHELLLERKIDKKKLDQILKENSTLDAYYKALRYISRKMRTKVEIEKYLRGKDFGREEISYAVKKLEEEGYLDSKRYVKAFVNDSLNLSLDGPKKILSDLLKLGIDESLIYEELDKIDDEVWEDRIKKVIEKRAKVNKNGLSMFKNKVTSNLMVLGYPLELVKPIVENCKIDTSFVFSIEADKIYRMLNGKFTGTELALRFRNKMYSKGFDVDDINSYLDSLDN